MRSLCVVALLAVSSCSSAPPAQTAPANHFFVFLVRPADAPQVTKEEGAQIQAGHMANIKRLHEEGHLVAAGPFLDDTRLRGIFVYRTSNADDARQWLASDPAVEAHRLAGEMYRFAAADTVFRKPRADAKVEMIKYAMIMFSGDQPISAAAEAHHAAFAQELDRDAKLAFSTRFEDGGNVRAVMVLVATPEEATAVAARDPYVTEAHLRTEVHPWMTQQGVLARP